MLRPHRHYAAAASILALALASKAAGAQQNYPQTLYWGAGLIDIPVAWVSPISGDFAVVASGKTIRGAGASQGLSYDEGLNTNLALSGSIAGRAEVGVAVFSGNPEWGLFGQALLVNEEDFRRRQGLARWMPSLAVGLRNVGPYDKIDRFSIGYALRPGTSTDANSRHIADSLHSGFSTRSTVYGVATKSFSLSELTSKWPNVGMSLSLGYGNGLFKDDGGLGASYAKHATGGVFGGIKVDVYPSQLSTLSFMLENNAWDYNLGAAIDYRGLTAGLYWTEVGSGSMRSDIGAAGLYNYSKLSLMLGWRSNALALLRGDFLRRRVTELERQRDQLRAEIAARQQRIVALQTEINRYEAQNLLELEQRRAQAEQELRAEREALQRLEERLRRLEQNDTPSPQKPPK
jgi:hypothetical protein